MSSSQDPADRPPSDCSRPPKGVVARAGGKKPVRKAAGKKPACRPRSQGRSRLEKIEPAARAAPSTAAVAPPAACARAAPATRKSIRTTQDPIRSPPEFRAHGRQYRRGDGAIRQGDGRDGQAGRARQGQARHRRRRRRRDENLRPCRRILAGRPAPHDRGANQPVRRISSVCGPIPCAAFPAKKQTPYLPADPRDKRFASPDWQDNPAFDFLRQAYCIANNWATAMVEDAESTSSPTTRPPSMSGNWPAPCRPRISC